MADVPDSRSGGGDEGSAVSRGDAPTSAGISPAGVSRLRRFLADLGRETATFELTVADDQKDTGRYCWSGSIGDRGDDGRASVRCVPLAPGEPTFYVDVDEIALLAVVDLPRERFLTGAETAAERATAHRRLATAAPETASVARPLGLLDRDDVAETVQRDATRALREIARRRPADCTPAVPVLRGWLETASFAGRADALATLRAIGENDPGAIAPARASITSSLGSSGAAVRRAATGCVAALACEAPEDVVDTVPDLVALAAESGETASLAVTGLAQIAVAHPDAVRPHAATLRTALFDDARPDAVRLAASAGLGQLVSDDPSLGVDLVDDLVSILDAAEGRLRSNVAGIVCDVAMVHTDVVAPHVDALAPLLSADEPYARVNASGAIGRVAAAFPAAVEHHRDAFVDLLDDDERVRENACWTLGRVGTAETRATLETVARTDDHERVRKRASWAVRNLETAADARAPTDA